MQGTNYLGADMSARLAANIEALAERRRREEREAPLSVRIAARITAFTGSMKFVVLHVIVYGFWIVANLGWVPGVEPWDETFVILAMEASVEAIFLSTFVLINQNRQAEAADRRADLDLHVGLLAEDELSKLARVVARIAETLDVPVERKSFDEIEKNVDPEQVLDAIGASDERHEEALEMKASTAS
ncbi:DUF1003 domain-containing protein [Paracoccus sp. S-4012]|uniref:DUF1003 domain-containing protein n=1 Tax=Paracoccus sp. S-4012 TaxID=2665648 RepID=UPI0012B0A18C|nr:DUF1003 domain-containing protein [Paracoccus sp. S-4012]MRX51906.1 DUF1003 domain-containing protein [Paracoccus sp. S-4012]